MKKTTLILLFIFSVMLLPSLRAQETHRAALVVRMGDGAVETACVSFTEDTITGYELLVRSGMPLNVDANGAGTAVCSINNTGCPAADCFCQCAGSDCLYWSYWHRPNGVWEYSQGGASVSVVVDGAIEGWSWGPGSVNNAVPPPDLSFADVCEIPATATPVTPGTPLVINTLASTAVMPTSTPVLVTQTPALAHTATATLATTATAGATVVQTVTPTADSPVSNASSTPTQTVVPETIIPPQSTIDATDKPSPSPSPLPTAMTQTAVLSPSPTSNAMATVLVTNGTAVVNAITAVTEPATPTPADIAVIGASETTSALPNAAEAEENTGGGITPYLFFLFMIGGLVGGRFLLSRRA